jgi:hypothetical protein
MHFCVSFCHRWIYFHNIDILSQHSEREATNMRQRGSADFISRARKISNTRHKTHYLLMRIHPILDLVCALTRSRILRCWVLKISLAHEPCWHDERGNFWDSCANNCTTQESSNLNTRFVVMRQYSNFLQGYIVETSESVFSWAFRWKKCKKTETQFFE